jgi:gephyrin
MAGTGKLRASILIISETAYQDPSTDKCVPALQNVFSTYGSDKWEIVNKRIVPDDLALIQKAVLEDVDAEINLVVTSGGTGFATKDVTPEVSVL